MPQPHIAVVNLFSSLRSSKRRSTFVIVSSAISVIAAVVLMFTATINDLWVAVVILAISLITFHAVALVTFDCAICWRSVDYPWVLAAFMAVLIALTNLYESARLAPLTQAVSDRKSAYNDLIYSLESVITNDCHPKPSRKNMWQQAPEPYTGACDRMEHFLPQIKNAATIESTISGLNHQTGWGNNIIIPDTDPVGGWAGLYSVARQFDDSSKRTQLILDDAARTPASPIAGWAHSNSLKYWYFILAYVLGLRLAKISAELLASKYPSPKKTPVSKDPPGPVSGTEVKVTSERAVLDINLKESASEGETARST